MTKTIFIFIFFTALGAYMFDVDKYVYNKFVYVIDGVKEKYSHYSTSTEDTISSYLNQSELIEELIIQNKENQKYKILYESLEHTIKNIKEIKRVKRYDYHNVSLVKVLSYITLNDFSKVLLDGNITLKEEKIYGLMSLSGYTAGVALLDNDRNIAYLNSNKKSNYTVNVGSSMAPGVAVGPSSNGKILIKHVPRWFSVKVNDEVVTSGLDNIFPGGIKVGKVVKVTKSKAEQEVIVAPYATVLNKKFFYVYFGKEK